MRLVSSLMVLLLVAASVAAQPEVPPLVETPDLAVSSAPDRSPLDGFLDGVGEAGSAVGGFFSGVGDALVDLGQGIADAASAIGALVGDALAATGRAAVAIGTGVGAAGAAVSGGLAAAFASLGRGTLAVADMTGGALAAGLITAVVGIWAGIAATGRGLVAAVGAYLDLIAPLRPERMPEGAFHAAALAGTAASAGTAAWAFWDGLRRWGAGLLGLAGFSRIDENKLLEHPLRRSVFETIQNQPGIHASALAREVGVGWGTIVHHLQKLEKARLVATRSVNNQKCFFENGGAISREDMAVASAMKGVTAARIATFVAHNPMATQKEIAERLSISPALASFHVKKLVAQGALDRVRDGKSWMLTASDGFRRVNAGGTATVASVHASSGRAVA